VFLVENRGYDSPDRWYEVMQGPRKVGDFGWIDDVVRACHEDAAKQKVLHPGPTPPRRTPICDYDIPIGYRVALCETSGFGWPEDWFEAREAKRELGRFETRSDAIEACRNDDGWRKNRYDYINEEDEALVTLSGPDACHTCGKTFGPETPDACTCDGCYICGKTHESSEDTKVRRRCRVCNRLICRDCTLLARGERKYLDETLCSRACWYALGSPKE